jgi:hypothetical protein
MVTPEEYERAQEILGRPGRPRPARHEFPYAGLFRCGRCGRVLTGEEHVKPSGRRFVYYRCHGRLNGQPCHGPSLPETLFEARFASDLERLAVPDEAVQWIVENLRATLATDLEQRAAARTALEHALAEAAREAETLLTLRLQGQIDDETFERKRTEIQDRQVQLRFRLDQPAASSEEVLRRLQALFRFSTSAAHTFRTGDAVQRRQIVQGVASNFRVQDRTPLYSAKEPFSFLVTNGAQSPLVSRKGRPSYRLQALADHLRNWLTKAEGFWVPKLERPAQNNTVPH